MNLQEPLLWVSGYFIRICPSLLPGHLAGHRFSIHVGKGRCGDSRPRLSVERSSASPHETSLQPLSPPPPLKVMLLRFHRRPKGLLSRPSKPDTLISYHLYV